MWIRKKNFCVHFNLPPRKSARARTGGRRRDRSQAEERSGAEETQEKDTHCSHCQASTDTERSWGSRHLLWVQQQVLQQEGQIVHVDFEVDVALHKQRQNCSSQRLKEKRQKQQCHNVPQVFDWVKGLTYCHREQVWSMENGAQRPGQLLQSSGKKRNFSRNIQKLSKNWQKLRISLSIEIKKKNKLNHGLKKTVANWVSSEVAATCLFVSWFLCC